MKSYPNSNNLKKINTRVLNDNNVLMYILNLGAIFSFHAW
jgi:hypothetical protein